MGFLLLVGELQASACIVLILLGVDFSSVAHGGHKFFLGTQLPSSLAAPAKQVEHFVPLTVQLWLEFGEDRNGGAGERFVAFEDVEIPDSGGVRVWKIVGKQAPEKWVEEFFSPIVNG